MAVAVGESSNSASEIGYAGALKLTGGLLSMGARVYNPALKIWMQPDPLQPFKYDYADGDPVNRIDPAGLRALVIAFQTYIPEPYTDLSVLGVNIGRFAGDGRLTSTPIAACYPMERSRTYMYVSIESDPALRQNPIIAVEAGAGATRRLDPDTGSVLAEATATKGLPQAEGSRASDGSAVVTITQNTKNPLSSPEALTPGIQAKISVTVNLDGSAVQAKGSVGRFPAYELSVITPEGEQIMIIQVVPEEDATPWDLLRVQPAPTAQGTIPSTP